MEKSPRKIGWNLINLDAKDGIGIDLEADLTRFEWVEIPRRGHLRLNRPEKRFATWKTRR